MTHAGAPDAVVRRGEDRFVTDQPGIRTWHTFSAGAHYDPALVSFGPVIGCDEHLVAPGAGFDWHAHRGVVVVSWVLDGTLRHEDGAGTELLVGGGELLVQSTGDGIRHRETNASDTDALRFVQTTLLLELAVSVNRPLLPVRVGELELDVIGAPATLAAGFAVVGDAGATLDGVALGPGDSVRLERAAELTGGGRVLHLAFS